MSGITHAIFDLDGTLLDTEVLYSRAAERVLGRFGVRYPLELKRRIMGGDSMRSAEIVVTTLKVPLSPAEYLALREQELVALLPELAPMDGAPELVSLLAARGVRMAIATSGHRAITAQKLALQSFLAPLSIVVCGDDPRLLHGKPAPDIFLLAASELGARPASCVVVEDSVNGVRAGVAASMRTVALVDPRWGFSPGQFGGAAHVVASLREVTLELLGLE